MSLANAFQGRTVNNAIRVLGYECDQTTLKGMTLSVIHQTDVPLLIETHLMGQNTTTIRATDIATAEPSETVFALPSGITPVENAEINAFSHQMVREMINTLKQADGATQLQEQWHRNGIVPAS